MPFFTEGVIVVSAALAMLGFYAAFSAYREQIIGLVGDRIVGLIFGAGIVLIAFLAINMISHVGDQ